MKACFSEEGCQKNNTSLKEVFLLLLYYLESDLAEVRSHLINKGYLTAERSDPTRNWRITRSGVSLINNVIVDSDKYEKSEEDILNLSEQLKEIFPKGKKDGTSNYWAEGKALIARRLKTFFKKYGETFTDEQILNAARNYVQSFNGNYQFMRTLKYFIFKDMEVAGEREYSSDLLNYIENAGHEDEIKNDWTSTLK